MISRSIESIDHRIERLQALMKLLRAERRMAVLREKHHQIKFSEQERNFEDANKNTANTVRTTLFVAGEKRKCGNK